MSNTAKDKARQLLEAELLRVETGRGKAVEAAKQLEAEARTLRASIKALNRQVIDSKPAPKKKDVIRVIDGLLRQHGTLAEAELKSSVWDQIAETGLSHAGLALRFEEALSNPTFVRSNGKVSLTT